MPKNPKDQYAKAAEAFSDPETTDKSKADKSKTDSMKKDSENVPMRSVSFKIPEQTAMDFQIFCVRNKLKKGELCNTALLFYMDKLIKEQGAVRP